LNSLPDYFSIAAVANETVTDHHDRVLPRQENGPHHPFSQQQQQQQHHETTATDIVSDEESTTSIAGSDDNESARTLSYQSARGTEPAFLVNHHRSDHTNSLSSRTLESGASRRAPPSEPPASVVLLVDIVGGKHRGKLATFVKRTALRIAVRVDETSNIISYLHPEHVRFRSPSAAAPSGEHRRSTTARPASRSSGAPRGHHHHDGRGGDDGEHFTATDAMDSVFFDAEQTHDTTTVHGTGKGDHNWVDPNSNARESARLRGVECLGGPTR